MRPSNSCKLSIIYILCGWGAWTGWAEVVNLVFVTYCMWLMGYAFKKTRKCPLQVMASCRVLSWPRAFRMVYREQATRMMLLYFSCAGLLVAKALLLLSIFVLFLSHHL